MSQRTGVLERFFYAKGHPENLAVFRLAVFGALFLLTLRQEVVFYSSLPRELLFPPFGWAWLSEALPITPEVAGPAKVLLLCATASAFIGFMTRTSAVIAVLLALYVLGVPQLYGKVNHYHFLVWFAALLALSPSGDALSVDAARTKGPRAAPTRAYALPIRLAWVLIGVIYFFPGAWKVVASGMDWVWGDAALRSAQAKWVEMPGQSPMLPFDEWPLFFRLGGLFTVAFELSFIFLVFSRRVRPFLAVAGLLFHNMTWAVMGISFWSLQLMYVTFVDWGRLFERVRARVGPRVRGRQGGVRTAMVVGGLLIGINVGCGVRYIDSWPFAVYPTFAVAPPVKTTLSLEVVGRDGVSQDLDPFTSEKWPNPGNGRMNGLLNRLLRVQSPEGLVAFWGVIGHDSAAVVRFWEERIPLDGSGAVPQRILRTELRFRSAD